MNQPLRVLIVEDSEADVVLLLHALRRGGYEAAYDVVETPAAMRAALARQDWDVITSDHAMPHFSAPAALALAKEVCPDVRAPTGGGRAAGARSALPVVGRGGKGPGHFHARSGGIHRELECRGRVHAGVRTG